MSNSGRNMDKRNRHGDLDESSSSEQSESETSSDDSREEPQQNEDIPPRAEASTSKCTPRKNAQKGSRAVSAGEHEASRPFPENTPAAAPEERNGSPDENRFRCPALDCNARFGKQRKLIKHMRKAHSEQSDGNIFKCFICGSSRCRSRSALEKHMEKHIVGRIFVQRCVVCKKVFLRRIPFQLHVRRHPDRPYKCDAPYCTRKFKLPDCLNLHKRTVHSESSPYKCILCAKRYVTKLNFWNHMVNSHLHDPNQCPLCGRIFTKQEDLHEHQNQA